MGAAIEIEDLEKHYGKVRAVDGVSLSVAEGEAFGYLGPNGSGKTTTIRCMLGLVRPTAGTIRVLGHPVATALPAILARVGYLPGEYGIWPAMTGEQVLDYLGDLHPAPPVRRAELLERFDLSSADLRQQVRFYSRGMKQKLGIVQAFQHDPELVILDEPTEGLDPVMKERFLALLREHQAAGRTLFFSSHILSEVEVATDRVAVLRKGRMAKIGPTRDLTGDRVRHCTLTLRTPTPPEALALPAAVEVEGDGTRYRFDVAGDMGPLLRRLAELDVEEFLAEPESLTEAFFDVYGEGT